MGSLSPTPFMFLVAEVTVVQYLECSSMDIASVKEPL